VIHRGLDREAARHARRADGPAPPFGWATKSGDGYAGFAVGGSLYRPDGTEELAPGGDPEVTAMFRPRETSPTGSPPASSPPRGAPTCRL